MSARVTARVLACVYCRAIRVAPLGKLYNGCLSCKFLEDNVPRFNDIPSAKAHLKDKLASDTEHKWPEAFPEGDFLLMQLAVMTKSDNKFPHKHCVVAAKTNDEHRACEEIYDPRPQLNGLSRVLHYATGPLEFIFPRRIRELSERLFAGGYMPTSVHHRMVNGVLTPIDHNQVVIHEAGVQRIENI